MIFHRGRYAPVASKACLTVLYRVGISSFHYWTVQLTELDNTGLISRLSHLTKASEALSDCCRALFGSCCAKPPASANMDESVACCTPDCSDCSDSSSDGTSNAAYSFLARPGKADYVFTAEALAAASCAPDEGLDRQTSKSEGDGSPRVDWMPFELAIEGMDCIDCSNKVNRAFKRLRGARATSMDYWRATVVAQCNPGKQPIVTGQVIC